MCAMRVARVSTIRVIVNGMVMIGMTVRVALGSVRNVARAFSRLVVASYRQCPEHGPHYEKFYLICQ
jgi:hypothetical protein